MDAILRFVAAVWSAITAYFHHQARKQFEEEQRQASNEAEAKREEKETEVKSRPDEQLDKDLSKWFRD